MGMKIAFGTLKKYTPEPGEHEVTVPDGVKKIGFDAFARLDSLNRVVLPQGLTTIEEYAFRACKGLREIAIPVSVNKIKNYAFTDCVSLERIELPNDPGAVSAGMFYNCEKLREIRLPDGVTELPICLFYGCKSLFRLEIPFGVSRINGKCFEGCDSLRQLIIRAQGRTFTFNIDSNIATDSLKKIKQQLLSGEAIPDAMPAAPLPSRTQAKEQPKEQAGVIPDTPRAKTEKKAAPAAPSASGSDELSARLQAQERLYSELVQKHEALGKMYNDLLKRFNDQGKSSEVNEEHIHLQEKWYDELKKSYDKLQELHIHLQDGYDKLKAQVQGLTQENQTLREKYEHCRRMLRAKSSKDIVTFYELTPEELEGLELDI